MAQVLVKNLNQGGIADSDYVGISNSVAEMVNCDIHSEPGLIKCNQALTKDSGVVVDEFCEAKVECSNGSTYFFGESGGIFERESGGTWTDRGTVSPGAGSAKVLSAKEYKGYIYYATQNRLGRIAVPPAGGSWAGRNDNFETFGVGDDTFHPMKVVNQVLYIGDGNQLAQVDDGTFSANALDIESPLRISSLGILDTDILIGTYVSNNVLETQIIRWNTWSVSFSVSDPIPEVGIYAFLETDNFVIVNAGTKGNLYLYNGAQLDLYKKIKGSFSSTNKAKVFANANLNFNGMPLFGLSSVSGTGVNLGVYSLARTNRSYPYILNLEHTISTGNLAGIEIGAIASVSADQFLVSWKDTNSDTSVGVDILNLSTKATAHFTTLVMYINRELVSEWGYAYAGYRSLPDGADIKFYEKKNGGAMSSELDSIDDKIEDGEGRNMKKTDAHIGDAVTLQLKTELVPNANNGPEVEVVVIDAPNN